MLNNILKATKIVTSFGVALGTKTIVTEIIKDSVTPESPVQKVTVEAATWVLSAMVADQASTFTDKAIDGAVDGVLSAKKYWDIKISLAKISKDMSTFEAEGLNPAHFEKNDKGRWVPRKPVEAVVIAS